VTAADERTIVQALYGVAASLDTRDWDALGAAFAADACGYGARGREAIVERVRAHLGGCGPSQHLLGNVRTTIDGDTASSLTYARVLHVGAGERSGAFYDCLGEYADTWARTPSGWLLTSRWFDVRIELGDRAVLQPG
jgi:hypothetical protein